MYFTSLPDHSKPGFDEQAHFSKFKKHNIIFNALSSDSHCDRHVGCLSFKTVLQGEEWYGVHNYQLAIRPGQFLILNDDQPYSCHIDHGESVRTLSIFFKKEFATSVFRDALNTEETLLDNPDQAGEKTLEFVQTLNDLSRALQHQLSDLIASLNCAEYDSGCVDEYLVLLLHNLIGVHRSDSIRTRNVNAAKSSTRTEVYKRLCVAKDFLHSSYMDKPDLNSISAMACLSVPQLVRHFKSVLHTTPHQYLIRIRLQQAAALLKRTDTPVGDVTWACGFENVSAFCRAFKSEYGIQPGRFRKLRKT